MNWVAIVIAAIAQFIIGWVWYGPLFGKTWMSMMGMSQQSMSREGMGKTMTLTFIGSLVTAAVLSMLVGWMGAKTPLPRCRGICTSSTTPTSWFPSP
ncbi:MAG: hypothetical protein AUI83_22120 [Armatimonadetes bacterium 13_1_40CM_3_65_7]|nr:MAG: hypothetical protein AUI83_22120 [Armatimonadetes bacterium 13_1_40CM_3_65_7]